MSRSKILVCAFIGVMLILTAVNLISANSSKAVSADEGQSEYIVRTYEDSIGIFTPNNDLPVRVLRIDPASLPYSDRLELEQGISVESFEELLQLIEDYIS